MLEGGTTWQDVAFLACAMFGFAAIVWAGNS